MRFEKTVMRGEDGKVKRVRYEDKVGTCSFSVVVESKGLHFEGRSPEFRTRSCLIPLFETLDLAMHDYWKLADEAGVPKEETIKTTRHDPDAQIKIPFPGA